MAITDVALTRAAFAASLSLAAIAASTFLIDVFTLERIDLLRAALFADTRILFFADLILTPPFAIKFITVPCATAVKIQCNGVHYADTDILTNTRL